MPTKSKDLKANEVDMAFISKEIDRLILTKALNFPQLFIPNDTKVIITYVKDYSTVYVRPVATSKFYSKFIKKIEHAALEAPKLSTNSLRAYPIRNEW